MLASLLQLAGLLVLDGTAFVIHPMLGAASWGVTLFAVGWVLERPVERRPVKRGR